jgi:carbon-monoxide dehydrogenase large subunit
MASSAIQSDLQPCTTIAHVAVDPATGQVEVLDFVTVDDVGRVINPSRCTGQVVGATVQGLGSVFSGEIRYDASGRRWSDRSPIISFRSRPTIRMSPRSRSKNTFSEQSLGAKGRGEGGIIPVGGALTNAVASALVVRHRAARAAALTAASVAAD